MLLDTAGTSRAERHWAACTEEEGRCVTARQVLWRRQVESLGRALLVSVSASRERSGSGAGAWSTQLLGLRSSIPRSQGNARLLQAAAHARRTNAEAVTDPSE
jgi:hypothetical protein